MFDEKYLEDHETMIAPWPQVFGTIRQPQRYIHCPRKTATIKVETNKGTRHALKVPPYLCGVIGGIIAQWTTIIYKINHGASQRYTY